MDFETLICAIAFAILTIMIVPIALADQGCAELQYYQTNGYNSSHYIVNEVPQRTSVQSSNSIKINPTKAVYTRSDFGGDRKVYHAYYTDISTGPVWLYDSKFTNSISVRSYSLYENYPRQSEDTVSTENGGIRSQYYYDKTDVRSQPLKIVAYKRGNQTVKITSISDLEKSTYSKKPKKVTNDQYDYYYRPDKYTTLDISDHYYSVERVEYRRGIENEN